MTTTRPDVPSRQEPSVGSLLADRYRLDEQIGAGGMASVFRATDESLGRTVAIKLFRQDVADAADVRRQDAEVRLVAGLSHPNVVTLFDAVADDDRAFLVLQHVPGVDLRTALHDGPLDRATAASIAADVAEALAYVHARGVIHRDLKPANILVQRVDGRTTAMLTDFGIAQLSDGSRLTATGSVLGTAAFLSPEQAVGAALTPASDIYSLGLVIIESLTGERVFPGTGIESAVARLSADPALPDDLSAPWRALLAEMTTREPEQRPSAADVAERLRAITAQEQFEPTRRLPALDAESATTEPLHSHPDAVASAPPTSTAAMQPTAAMQSTEPMQHASHPRSEDSAVDATPRRPLVIALVAAAVVVAIGLGWWVVSTLTPSAPPAATVEYPAVEGELGVSLELLQGSVEP
jgi:eukaryotic-like serine/threonine-protein kinase